MVKRKKRKLKKKPFIVLFLIIIGIVLLLNLSNGGGNVKEKLITTGYKDHEVEHIIKNAPKGSYNSFLKTYNKSLIEIITTDGYKSENFNKYVAYYDKNSKANIKDIITIINSGYDLTSYPASSLLANLVKEKYYLNKNVARYLDYGNNKQIEAKKIISIVNSNVDLGFYSKSFNTDMKQEYVILVNKFYRLKDNYEPNDLVTLTSKYNKGANSKLRKEAAEAFMKMVDGALLDGITLYNASAYRSYKYQVDLYNNYVARDGKEKADIYSARPGYSEHQTGLCTDINTIDSSFANTKEAKWLAKNAYKYGFILRFPNGKEDITGYKYEPWHYRYVGEKIAKVIYNEDLTLEEYYAYYIEK